MADRNPVPLLEKLSIDNVTEFKNIDCKHYELCLDQASDDNWPQFHCNSCEAYEQSEESLDLIKLLKALNED